MESLLRPRRGFQSLVSHPRSWRAVSCSQRLGRLSRCKCLALLSRASQIELSTGPLLAERFSNCGGWQGSVSESTQLTVDPGFACIRPWDRPMCPNYTDGAALPPYILTRSSLDQKSRKGNPISLSGSEWE